ncbi:hypothetical protein AOLI_G00036170 [Acnodon oligacanthus]
MALSMLALGAKGETHSQIFSTLGYSAEEVKYRKWRRTPARINSKDGNKPAEWNGLAQVMQGQLREILDFLTIAGAILDLRKETLGLEMGQVKLFLVARVGAKAESWVSLAI